MDAENIKTLKHSTLRPRALLSLTQQPFEIRLTI